MANSGYIVSYIKKDGSVQHANVFHHEQVEVYSKFHRLFMRPVDSDGNQIVDPATGKKLVAVKHKNDVTFIGFID